jgi:hypothetical protein
MTPPPDGSLTVSHWGAYRVHADGGRVNGVTAFEDDAEPSVQTIRC